MIAAPRTVQGPGCACCAPPPARGGFGFSFSTGGGNRIGLAGPPLSFGTSPAPARFLPVEGDLDMPLTVASIYLAPLEVRVDVPADPGAPLEVEEVFNPEA